MMLVAVRVGLGDELVQDLEGGQRGLGLRLLGLLGRCLWFGSAPLRWRRVGSRARGVVEAVAVGIDVGVWGDCLLESVKYVTDSVLFRRSVRWEVVHEVVNRLIWSLSGVGAAEVGDWLGRAASAEESVCLA